MSPRAVALVALVMALALPAGAAGAPHAPPPGQVFAGVTGGRDTASFALETGRRPQVFQSFTHWGQGYDWIFRGAEVSRARTMIHLSTFDGTRELVTPGAIARGEGDGYLLGVNARLARSAGPVYLRLMSEMNGHWNVYSAFDRSGRSRGRDHSTAAFRQAWRRATLIVRGGATAAIDARLAALGMRPVGGAGPALPRPQVALLWVPQVAGAPDTRANAPRAYWPGGEYVDWVGTDFYSRFPNFRGLERFYREFPGKPFAFGEWAVWGRDDPAFVRRFFSWMRSHPRVRMAMYNQGNQVGGPFRLSRYPRSAAALRRELANPRFDSVPPELAEG